MKITYLFLIYKNANIVYHTCQKLSGEGINFLIHVDKNSHEDFSMLKTIKGLEFSDVRYATAWGSSGLVKATAYCLKLISKTYNTDYVILMSESDYPVKSSEAIVSYLNHSNKDYARATLLPNEYPLENKDCYWLEGGMRRVNAYPLSFGAKGIASIEPRTFNWGNIRQFGKLLLNAPNYIPRAIKMLFLSKRITFKDMPWCGGDQWFILRIATVNKIVERIENDERILQEADNTIVPDEIIFSTLIHAVSPIGQRENKTLRYIHWTSKKAKSPSSITMDDTTILDKQIVNPNILFVRKVESLSVIEYIDNKIGLLDESNRL